jgi:CBS domain-containing protein
VKPAATGVPAPTSKRPTAAKAVGPALPPAAPKRRRDAEAPRPTVVTAHPVPPGPPARAPARPHPWPHLTARDVMRRDVITIDRATPLSEVERVLADQKISGAPVTDETGAIVGVISLRDLVERYVEDTDARPRRSRGYFHLSTEELEDDDYELTELPEETEETAEDVMTAEVFAIDADAPLAEVARTMVERRIHRVLVSSGGHFAGIVGSFEVLQAIAFTGAPGPSQGSPP